MKPVFRFWWLLFIVFLLCSCASGGKWEVIGHHNSPFISKDRFALRMERCNKTAFHPIAERCRYDIIFTDGMLKKVDYSVVGREVEQYILKSGLYDSYKKSEIHYRHFDPNAKKYEQRPKAIPEHRYVVVSVLPTIVLMVPLADVGDFTPVAGEERYIPYHRRDSVRCDVLLDHAVITGNKVPFRDNILWFTPKKDALPEKINHRWLYSGEAWLDMKRMGDTLFIRRKR